MGCTASVTDRAAEARKAEREKKERARPNNGLPMMRYKFAPSSPIATFKFPTSHDGSLNGSFDDAASPPEDGSLLDEAALCKISSTAENAKGSSSGSPESKSSSSANKYAVPTNDGTPRSTTPTLTTPTGHEAPPLPGLGFAATLLRVPDANSALGQKSSNEDHNDRSFEFPPELDSTQLLDPALAAGSPDGRGLPPPASLGSGFAKLPLSASPPGTARSAGQQSTSMAGSMASPVHSKHRNDALENTAPPTQWSQTGSPLFGHTAAPTPLDAQPGPAMPGSAHAHHEHKKRDAEEGSLPSDRRGHKPPAPGSATGGAAGGATAAFGEVSSDALSLASSADGSPLLDAWNPAVRSGAGTAGSAAGSAGRDGGSTANTHDGPGDSSLWERSGMAVSGGVMSNDAAASQGNAQMTTSSHSDDRRPSEGSTVWDRSQRRPSQQSAIGLSAISMGMSVSGRSGAAMSDAAADPLTPLRLTSLNADMAALAAAAAAADAHDQKKNAGQPHQVQEIPSPKHHNEGSPAAPEEKPKSVGSQAPTTQGAVPQLAFTGPSVVPEPMLGVDRVDGEHAGPQAASFTSGLDVSSTTPKNSRFHHSKVAQGQHLRPGDSPLLQSSTATAPPPLQSEPVTPVTTTDASSSADSRRLLAGVSQPNDVSGSAPEAAALAPKSAFSGSATPSPAGAADSRDLSMTSQPPFPGEPPAMSMAGLSTSSAAMLALDAATLHRATSPASKTPGGALTPNKNTSSPLTADDAVIGNSSRDSSPRRDGDGDQEGHHGGGRSCSQHSHLSHQSEHSERSAVGNAMSAARYRRHVPEPIDSDFGGSSTSFPAGSAGVSPGSPSGVHPSGLESAESFGVTHSSQHSEVPPASALASVSPSAARLSPGGRVSPAASPSSQPLLHSPFMPPSAGPIGMAQLSPNMNGAASSLHSASTSPSGRDPHLHPLNRSPPAGSASGGGGVGGSTHHLAELCDVDRARGECRLPDAPRPLSPASTLRRGDGRGVVSPNSMATVGPTPQHDSSVSPQRKVLSPDGGGASRTAHELRRVGSGGATAVRRLRGAVHESSLDRASDPQSESTGTGPQTTAETGADAGPPRELTSGGGQNAGHGENNGHPQHGHGGHDGANAHHVHFAGLETSSSSSASVGSAHSSMMATPVRGAVPPSEHQHYQQRFLTAADGSGTGALRPALPRAESQGGATALGPIPLQDDDDDDGCGEQSQLKPSTTLQRNFTSKEPTAHRSLSETDDDLTPKVRATLSPIEPKPGLQSSIAGGSTTGLCASRTHTSQLAGAKHSAEGEQQNSIPPSPQNVNPHSRPLPAAFGSSRTESPARSPSALGPLIPPASPTSSGSMRLQPGSPAVSSLGRDRSALLSSFTRQTHSRGQQGSVSPQRGATGAAALSLIPTAGSTSDLLLGNVPESPFIDATIAHSALQSTASFQSQSPASPVPLHSGAAGAGAASVSAFPTNPAVTPTRPRGMTHTSATSSSRRTNEETSTSFREQHDSPLRSGGGTRGGVLHTGGLVSRLSNSGIRGEEMGSGIGGAGVAASSVGPLSLGSSLAPFGDSNTSHLAAQSVGATPTNGRRAPPAQQPQQQHQPPASLQQQHLPGQDPRHLVQLHGIQSASQSGSDGQSLLSDRPGDPLTAPDRNTSGSS